MIWEILGIEPTKDTKAIKNAYRAVLVNTNPEEKPEEFMALKDAYDQAMEYAKTEEQPEEEREVTPVTLWIDKVREVYYDFGKRVNPDEWKQLLADDVCFALDTRSDAEKALLEFFMEQYFLPQSIWHVLDEHFSWMEREGELKENYPPDFIDYVILNGIRYEENLPYDMFEPGTDGVVCDEYIRLFSRANNSEPEERAEYIEQIVQLAEKHPYGRLFELCNAISSGDQSRLQELHELQEKYPENPRILMDTIEMNHMCEEYDSALELAVKLNELYPEYNRTKWLLAQSYAMTGKYKDGVDVLTDMIQMANGDQQMVQSIFETIKEWNSKLIDSYVARIEADPNDSEAKENLAWCYLQNDMKQECFDLVDSIHEGELEDYKYHNLMCQVYYAKNEYESSLEHVNCLIDIIKELKPDGTEQTLKRIGRLPDRMTLRARILFSMKRIEEAAAAFDEVHDMFPENGEIVTDCIYFYATIKNYAREAELAQEYTRLEPNSAQGYFFLASALYMIHYDQDAYNAANRALELNGSILIAYIIRILLLIRNDGLDNAQAHIDYLKEQGLEDDVHVKWCEAMLAKKMGVDDQTVLSMCEAIANRIEEGESFEWVPAVYYEIALAKFNSANEKTKEVKEECMAVLDKGLQSDDMDEDCLDLKAWLLKSMKRYDEAFELYKKEEKLPNHSLNVERSLADIYYNDLKSNADIALEYYNKVLDSNPENPELLFYAGMCHLYIKNFEKAEEMFLREKEVEPEYTDAPHRLTYVYMGMGRLEDALAQAEETISIIENGEYYKDDGKNHSQDYLRKAQVLRRMGRPYEAASVIEIARDKYNYSDTYSELHGLFCQFGMWQEADKVLSEWKQSASVTEYGAAEIKSLLMRCRIAEAKKLFRRYKGKIDKDDLPELEDYFATIDGTYKVSFKIWERKLADCAEDNIDYRMHIYMNLAQASWRAGFMSMARNYAKQGLECADKLLGLDGSKKAFDKNIALTVTKRAMLLAFVDSREAALEQLEQIKEVPLCEFCTYGVCKDAEIYRSDIEAIYGNFAEAEQISIHGMTEWPDEIDFMCQLENLKRKGRI